MKERISSNRNLIIFLVIVIAAVLLAITLNLEIALGCAFGAGAIFMFRWCCDNRDDPSNDGVFLITLFMAVVALAGIGVGIAELVTVM